MKLLLVLGIFGVIIGLVAMILQVIDPAPMDGDD